MDESINSQGDGNTEEDKQPSQQALKRLPREATFKQSLREERKFSREGSWGNGDRGRIAGSQTEETSV